jgi:hypothetical protein
MHIHGSYVMREQVRDLVPSIMSYDVTRPARVRETGRLTQAPPPGSDANSQPRGVTPTFFLYG